MLGPCGNLRRRPDRREQVRRECRNERSCAKMIGDGPEPEAVHDQDRCCLRCRLVVCSRSEGLDTSTYAGWRTAEEQWTPVECWCRYPRQNNKQIYLYPSPGRSPGCLPNVAHQRLGELMPSRLR